MVVIAGALRMVAVIVSRVIVIGVVLPGCSRLRRDWRIMLVRLRGLLEDFRLQDQGDGSELLDDGDDETDDET